MLGERTLTCPSAVSKNATTTNIAFIASK
jgi:hypothetical protein